MANLPAPRLRQTGRRVSVNAELFAMASLFVSQEAARQHLNGVLVTPHEKTGVYLVATDGHRMAIVYDEGGKTNGDWICPPVPGLARAVARMPPEDSVLTLKMIDNMVHGMPPAYDEEDAVASWRLPAIDGTFPDWRRVVPTPGAPVAVQAFNIGYLATAELVARIRGVGEHGIVVQSTGDMSPALIHIPSVPEILIVQMPIRDYSPPSGLPGWLTLRDAGAEGKAPAA